MTIYQRRMSQRICHDKERVNISSQRQVQKHTLVTCLGILQYFEPFRPDQISFELILEFRLRFSIHDPLSK